MKKCQNCGMETNIEGDFCGSCGTKIIESNNGEIHNEEVIVESQKNQQTSKVSEVVENIKGKLKGNKKYAIIGAVALVIVVTILFKAVNIFTSPENKVLMGMYNLAKEEEKKGSVKLSVDSKNKDFPDIVKDMNLEVFYDYNLNKQETKAKGILSIKNDALIEIGSAMDKDAIYIDLFDLYDKYFYVKMDADYAMVAEDVNKLLKYLKDVNLKGVKKDNYIEALGGALKKSMSKEGGKIVVTATEATAYDMLDAVVKVAKSDKKLADAIYSDMDSIRKNMKKDNVKFNSYELEDFMEELDEMPTRKEFVEDFNAMIDDMYQDLKSDRGSYKNINNNEQIKMVFDISMLNKIKTIECSVDVDGIKGTLLLDAGKTFKTKSYNMNSGIDLERMIDSDKAEDIGYEIVNNLGDKLLKNDKLIKALEESEISDELYYNFGTRDIREIFEMFLEESF